MNEQMCLCPKKTETSDKQQQFKEAIGLIANYEKREL